MFSSISLTGRRLARHGVLTKVSSPSCRWMSGEAASRTSRINSRTPVTWKSLLLMAITGAGILSYYRIEKENRQQEANKQVVNIGKPALGGPWSLVDSHGIPKTDANYFGKMTLLYFGFTYCPDICPSELVKVGKIINALEKRGYGQLLTPLFISVDPARDTLAQMRHYAQDFHPSFEYLTGTPEQVAAAAKSYRVYFSKAHDTDMENADEYLVDHSIVFYLMSPTGEFLDFFTQSASVGEVADKIAAYAKECGIAPSTPAKK